MTRKGPRAAVTWSQTPLVARGKPAKEFVQARELRRKYNISMDQVARIMTQLLGYHVGISGISEWERGITRPRRTEPGQLRYRAWKQAMQHLVAKAAVEDLAEKSQHVQGDGVTVYTFGQEDRDAQ